MTTVYTNIKELFQIRDASIKRVIGSQMKECPSIKNAFIKIKDGVIEDFGIMSDLVVVENQDQIVDVQNTIVTPGYVDSHTHLVFAATREKEFEDRINGLTYEQIAARGGGILNSAARLQNMSEDELYEQALIRLKEVIKTGTTSIEIKSGYGLSMEGELKMLRVIKRLKETELSPGVFMSIKATFLGAHAVPLKYKDNKQGYVDFIIAEMLPKVASENLADYIDVFCEKNYFSLSQMVQILEAGAKYGLKAKVHVNQFNALGAIEKAVEHNAISVDHLEVLEDEDLISLSNSNTIATALPSCSFFLGLDYTPVHDLMDKDIAVALASDYNPGSTPSGNLNFVFSLACIKMKMTPQQAFNALTINAAAAVELDESVGSITKGKRADLLFFKNIDNLAGIPYNFGTSQIDKVMISGTFM